MLGYNLSLQHSKLMNFQRSVFCVILPCRTRTKSAIQPLQYWEVKKNTHTQKKKQNNRPLAKSLRWRGDSIASGWGISQFELWAQ